MMERALQHFGSAEKKIKEADISVSMLPVQTLNSPLHSRRNKCLLRV